MYRQIMSELDSADDYIKTRYEVRIGKWSKRFTLPVFLITLLALVYGFFGMNFACIAGQGQFGWLTSERNFKWLFGCSIVFALVMIVSLCIDEPFKRLWNSFKGFLGGIKAKIGGM